MPKYRHATSTRKSAASRRNIYKAQVMRRGRKMRYRPRKPAYLRLIERAKKRR